MAEATLDPPTDDWEGVRPQVSKLKGVCPHCNEVHDVAVEEERDGSFFVPDTERYVRCSCEAQLDFGVRIGVMFEHEVGDE